MDSRRHFWAKFRHRNRRAPWLPCLLMVLVSAWSASGSGFIGFGDRATDRSTGSSSARTPRSSLSATFYTKQLERAKGLAPGAATYLDYRRLLDNQSIDAVVIATPQHLHAEHFCASLGAGKHVYQEKTMAFTVDSREEMRAAFQKDGGKHTVQIGHQSCSSAHMTDVQPVVERSAEAGERSLQIDMPVRNIAAWSSRMVATARITPGT